MLTLLNHAVLSMALLRMISGSIEFSAALWMLHSNNLQKAILINSGLALVGPIVLFTTTAIGLVGIAERLSPIKLFWILLGVAFIFIGVRSR